MPGEYGPTGLGRLAACTGRCDGWDMTLLDDGDGRARDRPAIVARVPRFKLTIEYAGTRYSGWQKQKNARTVQGELDRAIVDGVRRRARRVAGLRPHRRRRARAGAGGAPRRHAGAGARACCAGASTTRCPPTSTCSTSRRCRARFHARHSAVRRSYLYQISRRRSAFAKPFVWWVKEPLDLAAHARTAAAGFVGMHDFRAFCDDDPEEKSTRVLLDEVTRGRRRRAVARPRRRLALPVEDGAAHGRRARAPSARATSPPDDVRRAAAGAERRAGHASRRRRPGCSWSACSTRATPGREPLVRRRARRALSAVSRARCALSACDGARAQPVRARAGARWRTVAVHAAPAPRPRAGVAGASAPRAASSPNVEAPAARARRLPASPQRRTLAHHQRPRQAEGGRRASCSTSKSCAGS